MIVVLFMFKKVALLHEARHTIDIARLIRDCGHF